jgi:hypothetical protein
MLTIFSTPKPFVGHNNVIQRNALMSWKLLHPGIEVVLYGDEPGAAEACRDIGIRHEPFVRRNENGTKFLNHLFEKTYETSPHKYLCYVNCDIILGPDFVSALQAVSAVRPQFLMIGRRWDANITEPWNFEKPDWFQDLRSLALRTGRKNGPSWVDYFCFSRELYHGKMPPFLIGRHGWDPWLTYFARKSNYPLVDATRTVVAVHQNHDYAYLRAGGAGAYTGSEVNYNWKLGDTSAWHFYTTYSATEKLVRGKLIRNRFAWLGTTIRRLTAAFYKLWFGSLILTRPIRHRLGLRRAVS